MPGPGVTDVGGPRTRGRTRANAGKQPRPASTERPAAKRAAKRGRHNDGHEERNQRNGGSPYQRGRSADGQSPSRQSAAAAAPAASKTSSATAGKDRTKSSSSSSVSSALRRSKRHHNARPPATTSGASDSPALPQKDGRRSAGSFASRTASSETPAATSSAASSETSSTASGQTSPQSRSKSTKHSSGLVSQTSAEDYVALWDAADNPHVVNPETLQSIRECFEAAEAESSFVSHLQGILATIPLSVLKTEGALQMIFGCFDPAILELVLYYGFEALGLSARTLSKTKRKIKMDRKEVHGAYWKANASTIGKHRKAFQWMAENHTDPEVRQFATKRLKRSEDTPRNDSSCVSYAGTCWGKPIGERLDEPQHGLEAKVFKALGGPTHEMCVARAVPKCEVQSKILEAAFATFIQGATILSLRSRGCDDSYCLMTSDGSELNVANCGEVYWDQLSFGGIDKVIDWLMKNSGKTDLTPWSDPVTPVYVHGWMSAKGPSILGYFASKPEFVGVTSLDEAKIRGLLSYLGAQGGAEARTHKAVAGALKDVDNNVNRLSPEMQDEFHRILKKFRDEEHFWVCMKNHQRPLQERVESGEELTPVEKKTLVTYQKDAKRKRKQRQSGSEAKKAARKAKDAERKRKSRSKQSEEERAAEKAKNAKKIKDKRNSESEAEKAARRAKNAERNRKQRNSESEEERKARNERRREKRREKRKKEEGKKATSAKNAKKQRRKKEEGKKATSAKKT